MGVAQPGEDGGELGVEAPVGKVGTPLAEQPEALDRVGGVHRPLQGQVAVETVEQGLEGVEHLLAVAWRQRRCA